MEYVNQLAKDAQSSVESLIGSPKLTLFYFDIHGPAEPARLALTIGGIEFTDKRVTFDEENESPFAKRLSVRETYQREKRHRRTFRGFALTAEVDLAASPRTFALTTTL